MPNEAAASGAAMEFAPLGQPSSFAESSKGRREEGFRGLGFRVWGLGFRGLGFRVWGLGFRAGGLGGE